jgi:hypothetical protein
MDLYYLISTWLRLRGKRATPLSAFVEKIYGRSQEPEINRFKTWTFDHFCAPMDLRADTGGEAPASLRHRTWS